MAEMFAKVNGVRSLDFVWVCKTSVLYGRAPQVIYMVGDCTPGRFDIIKREAISRGFTFRIVEPTDKVKLV